MLTQAGFEPPTKLLVKGQGREGGGGGGEGGVVKLRSLSRLENPSTPIPC